MNYLKELVCGKRVSISDKAYAKINLGLDVLRKREDGYHNIKSVMSPISLYDELYFFHHNFRG